MFKYMVYKEYELFELIPILYQPPAYTLDVSGTRRPLLVSSEPLTWIT